MSHTIKTIAGGFVLLGLFCGTGHLLHLSVRVTLMAFAVAWVSAVVVNLWVGVSKAGYSVRDELPIALLNLAVPASVALIVLWKVSSF